MRNFTWLLILSFLVFSCSKQNQDPGSGTPSAPAGPRTPAAPAAPTTAVTITVNGAPMAIDSLTFSRYGGGEGGGMTITALNAGQKVTAEVYHFYQHSGFDMMYTMEVSYFTRGEGQTGWGDSYKRPIPRDDEVRFNNFTPLSDSVVTGSFSGTFDGGGGIEKGGAGQGISIQGNFGLVFIKR